MATTGQLFEELMATFHTLGIADSPLELHVLDVPGAHVAASRKQVAPALVTFFERAMFTSFSLSLQGLSER